MRLGLLEVLTELKVYNMKRVGGTKPQGAEQPIISFCYRLDLTTIQSYYVISTSTLHNIVQKLKPNIFRLTDPDDHAVRHHQP